MNSRPATSATSGFTYSNAGPNGRGDAWLLDCPVLSEIDEDGDGAFERLRRYLQNARGDVVGVEESNPWYDREAVRYSVFGFPEVFQNQDPYHTADFNGDGNPGTDADITAFFQCLAGTGPATYPVSLSFYGYWRDVRAHDLARVTRAELSQHQAQRLQPKVRRFGAQTGNVMSSRFSAHTRRKVATGQDLAR